MDRGRFYTRVAVSFFPQNYDTLREWWLSLLITSVLSASYGKTGMNIISSNFSSLGLLGIGVIIQIYDTQKSVLFKQLTLLCFFYHSFMLISLTYSSF